MENIFLRIAGAWLLFLMTSYASVIPSETDELIKNSDVILIGHVAETTYAARATHSMVPEPVDLMRGTAAVKRVLKGTAADRVEIWQPIIGDIGVFGPGDWIFFLKKTKEGLTVFKDPLEIKDGRVEWYASRFKWPSQDEVAKMKPGTMIGPSYTRQLVEKVAKNIEGIVKELAKKSQKY